jgi:hypothetical protein
MRRILLSLAVLAIMSTNLYSQTIIYRSQLNGNNISAYFQNTGIFNQNTTTGTAAGFEWPKSSGRFAIFTTGLSIGAKINNQYAQSMSSYKGEFTTGYTQGGVAFTNANFKIYKISRGDNSGNNPDYANWYLMIPYGAPYIDVNNNRQYDPGVDSIGIRNAAQVIFMCLTDGFAETHIPGEGFGGGVNSPMLYSQIAYTSWCYDKIDLKDMQFMKWEIINKGLNPWNSTYLSLVSDPDLGDANDDYIGCDTSKKLGFCYNADNFDGTGNPPSYGAAPPAVGTILFKTPKGMTSFNFFTNTGSAPPPCESDPNGEPVPAYMMMKGFKKDSSNFMNPMLTPAVPTKFVYTGDPETLTGWTEFHGSIQNCNGNTGTRINVNPAGDRRYVMSSGAENYTVNPNDTIRIVASQLIARGSSNRNSVTLLKNYANTAWAVYNSGFTVEVSKISSNVPMKFSLNQNYPNPFNPTTNIKFDVAKYCNTEISVFDVMGRKIGTLVNQKLSPGSYEVEWNASTYSSGIYYIRMQSDNYIETQKALLIK